MRNTFGVYLQVYKMQIIRSLTYKFDVYGNILMQLIIMAANSFFWKAIFRNSTTMKGVTVDTMLTYTVISSILSILLTTNVERRLNNSVRKGTIAIDMMRPINLYGIFLAEDLAAVTALIFQNALPVLLIGCLLIKVPAPASATSLVWFLISITMAFCINWLFAVIFGMWSFVSMEMDAMIQLKKHLLRLLSGSIIPVWFFPGWLRNILQLFPFVYLYQLPLDIYIGKCDRATLIKGLCVQGLWIVVLLACFLFLQNRISKRVMIQGG